MRKGFTPAHFPQACFFASLIFTAFSLTPTPSNAQTIGQNVFRDGFPRFVRVDTSLTRNVVLTDTVARLVPIPTFIVDPDTFVLSGVDWRYPSIAPQLFSPEDIDKIPEELEPSPGPQDFYLITDAPTRKVYLINATTPSAAENSFGGLGVLDKPVDAQPYRDSTANAILQVDWLFKTIDWRLNNSNLSVSDQLTAPSDAVILKNGKEVLIADTGRNRVVVIDTTTKAVVWEFTQAPNDNLALNTPVDVDVDPTAASDVFLITDKNNHRVILVERATKEIKLQFGTGQSGAGSNQLNNPLDADALPDGNLLIADTGNQRLIEVNRQFQIVYTFAHPLQNLRDADRIVENVVDQNKTLVVATNLPVNQNILPFRLAYFNEEFLSDNDNFDFTTPVNFDSVSFPLAARDVPAGTRIRLQLRSANVINELANAKWYGPTDTLDFYTGPVTAVNPVHDGNRFIQYRALLENDVVAQNPRKPLLTPILRNVKISAHYFNTNTTGVLTSTAIRDSLGLIITTWKRLLANSVLPDKPELRTQVQITVRILNESDKSVLFSQPLSTTGNLNQFDLSLIDLLRRKQAVRLQAELKTNNSGVTPNLNTWQLEWENTQSTASTLAFTDPAGRPVNFYRVASIADNPPTNVGIVFLSLDDMNLLPIEDAVSLQVRAVFSGDQQTVQLTEQPTGFFMLNPGYPAVMTSGTPNRANVLEGRSPRDTLVAQYVDPTNPADVSTARVVLIQNVTGRLQIENRTGASVDTVSVGDSLLVHITGETDRDLSPAVDTVFVRFINTLNSDVEDVPLIELANNTGEFRSRIGIPLVRSAGGLTNDGKLQVNGGEEVRAEYIDLDNSKLQDVVRVRSVTDDSLIFVLASNKAYDVFVAPNPYNARQHSNPADGFRIAVVANTGDVLLNRIEIYNLVGERVRLMEGSELPFQNIITKGQASATDKGRHWWDFRNDSGASVAAGTYWAKVYLRFTDSTSGTTQETTTMRKFVVVK
jgi:hypothetical protein